MWERSKLVVCCVHGVAQHQAVWWRRAAAAAVGVVLLTTAYVPQGLPALFRDMLRVLLQR